MVSRIAALVVGSLLVVGCDAPAPRVESPPPATGSSPRASSPASAPAGAPGVLEEHRFASPALGVTKRYVVYVPGDYASSGARYPVVYLLHGLGGNEDNWPKGGGVARAADELGLRALVVMPDGDAGFYVNGASSANRAACLASPPPFARDEPPADYCVSTPRYESYLAEDLVDEIDARYRTIATREGRGIAGLSMGGFGALVVSMRNLDKFSAAASTSGLVSLRSRRRSRRSGASACRARSAIT